VVSKKDFRHPVSCGKEAKETKFFLRMIVASDTILLKKLARFIVKQMNCFSFSQVCTANDDKKHRAQAPSSREAPKTKPQVFNIDMAMRERQLVLVFECFPGSWFLELGSFSARLMIAFSITSNFNSHKPPHLPNPLRLRAGQSAAGVAPGQRCLRVKRRTRQRVIGKHRYPTLTSRCAAKRIIHLWHGGRAFTILESFDYKPN